MAKYCLNCGTETKEEYKFCLTCGSKIENENQINTKSQYLPIKLNKSNHKLVIIIISIIVIIVVMSVMFFIFLGTESDSRFIGTWTVQSGSDSTFTGTLIFDSNGDLKSINQNMYITIGKWSVEGKKICLEYTLIGASIPKICCNYSFSNGGNSLTIYDPTGGTNILVLSK